MPDKSAQNITINDLVCFAVIKALKKFPAGKYPFYWRLNALVQESTPWISS